jgi:hypothetical protein
VLNAAYIDNGVEGLDRMFQSHDRARYTPLPVTSEFAPDLSPYDLLIVPNGCDSIAMERIADRVAAFLDAAKTLFCFDGWTTSWLPGNRWVYDCEKPTREIRYFPRMDRHNLLHKVPIDELIYMHGISGWWACGYIEPAEGADVLLADTWDRAVIVLDEHTTRGTMIMTASGPLGDCDLDGKENGLTRLYRNMLDYAAAKTAAVG